MQYIHPVAFIPNDLILDNTLHHSAKRVAAVLLFLAGRKNQRTKISVRSLAFIASLSPSTVQQALTELQESGYIASSKNYRYSPSHGRMVHAATSYIWLRRTGGYTMIRREILDYHLTPAAFVTLLNLYRCAGRSGRAFPSLRRIAGLLAGSCSAGILMAKSTICICLQALRQLQAVIRLHCQTRKKCYAANSYLLTNPVQCRSSDAGSPIFGTPVYINQITKILPEGKEKYGVGQFGILPDFGGDFAWDESLYFDGTGVKVFPSDGQDLLLSWG